MARDEEQSSDDDEKTPTSPATSSAEYDPPLPEPRMPVPVPAPALPKPKPKLDKIDKIKLGAALAPLLKPSINNMSAQIQAAEKVAEKKPDELNSVIGESCAPQIEHLAELITHERDKVVEDNKKKAIADAKRAAAAAEAKKKAKALAESRAERSKAVSGLSSSMAMLKATFARKASSNLIASTLYSTRHYYYFFVPLQLIVALVAIFAFYSAYLEGNGNTQEATRLSVAAGILGIIAAFINALDRYQDYHTKSEMFKKNSVVFARLKDDITMSNIRRLADGSYESNAPASLKSSAVAQIEIYEKQLQTLEESNGDLQMPLQLINVFDEIESLVHKRVEIYNEKVMKSMGAIRDRRHRENGERLYVDYVKKQEILITAYAFLVSQIQYNKGWLCVCSEFPYALPEPKSLTKRIKMLADEEITEIVQTKFTMPSEDDYEKAKKIVLSLRRSQGGSDIESGDQPVTL